MGERAAEALERGIELYGQGDLDAALGEWERALALDPGLVQAEEYATYVRDNYDALRAQLEGPAIADSTIDEDETTAFSDQPLSVGMGREDVDPADFVKVDSGSLPRVDIDASAGGLAAGGATADDFDLELGGGELIDQGAPSVPPGSPEAWATAPAPEEPRSAAPAPAMADDDWSDLIATAPPKVSAPPPKESPATRAETVRASPSSRSTIMFGSAGTPILPAETNRQGTGGSRTTSPAMRAALEQLEPAPPPALGFELDDVESSFGAVASGPGVGKEVRPFDLDGDPRPASQVRNPQPTQRTGGGGRALDEGLLAAYDDAFEAAASKLGLSPEPSFRRSSAAPVHGRVPSATQVATLLDLAQASEARGDRAGAVQAASAALELGREASGGLDARVADRLLELFLGLLGSLERTPLVAVSMHEITQTSLDHRTGFLLSRIDGMLTFEDILDVSGMSRLDTAYLLVSLIAKGYVEIR